MIENIFNDHDANISFGIGGITVNIAFDPSELSLKVDGAREGFVTQAPDADVRIRTQWVERCEEAKGRKVFDSGALWQLYDHNGSHQFRLTSPRSGPKPYKTATFNENFSSGEIHLHRCCYPCGNAVDPLEYPLDELLWVHSLSQGKGAEVHACGLVDQEGNGHLFVGQSEAGKTTLARLWQNTEGVKILSDDRIILRERDGEYWLYGTPWHGEAELCSPDRAPLRRVYLLNKGLKNELISLMETNAVARLFACCFPPFYNPDGLDFTLGFLEDMVRTVPSYELGFLPDERVVEFVQGSDNGQ
jgi:hypothetical protein